MERPPDTAGPSKPAESESESDDSVLAKSEYLTRQEVMKRRARRLRRLAKCYRDHYWLLMEELRRKHRDYIWRYGKEPYEDYKRENDAIDGENGVVLGDTVDNNNSSRLNNHDNGGDDVACNGRLGLGFDGGSFSWCVIPTCRYKAMALSNYCFSHILSDSKQVLYNRCQFAHKCGEDPILCGKPVLRSTVPSMCQNHMKPAELNIRRALKKSGASGAASNRLASKFHLVLTEYVRLIQSTRRARRVEILPKEDAGS